MMAIYLSLSKLHYKGIVSFKYNHVSANTLITGRMIPSGTNSPAAEV